MSAPAGMTDIREYMQPDDSWSSEFHLAVAGAGGQPEYTIVQNGMIWDMKGAKGFPWDGNSFDEAYIYQSITEVDPTSWTDPTAFKIFASKSWPGKNGAIAWAPRYFLEGGFNPPIITPDSTFRIYPGNGAAFTTATLGGPIMTKVEGPYLINFGGDLGVRNAIIQSYFWGAGFANMEKNYFIMTAPGQPSGHCQWELWKLTNGVYVLSQTSAFNTIVAGGAPALDFPSAMPSILP